MEAFERAKKSFIDGVQLLESGDLPGAEEAFTRSLESLPDRVSTLNNLAAVKIQLNKPAEAESFARKVLSLEGDSPEAWSNLGLALFRVNRHTEAIAACERALSHNPQLVRAWQTKAEALLALQQKDDALSACDEALRLSPGNDELLYTRCLILKALERADEARKSYLDSLANRVMKSPAFSCRRRATQRADILIVSADPALDDSFKSFATLHLECLNYPGQLVASLGDEFRFRLLFNGDAPTSNERRLIPQPDLVINNHTNAELIHQQGVLKGLTELVDSFGVPVVNHPTRAAQTSRDATARLAQGIPGLRVPKTLRFSTAGKPVDELAREIEAEFNYPLITRTLTKQQGAGMEKCDTRADLIRTLGSGLPETFFVTEFVDSRNGREFYRKLRASIVGDEIILVRADFDSQWKIFARKSDERVAFYRQHPQLLEAEKRICAAPEAVLGQQAIAALQELRRRVPLDIFGVDFDVDGEGALVFYEANATMNLLSTARAEVPYPEEANDRLLAAFRTYLTGLAVRN